MYTSSSPAGGAAVYRMSHTGGVACDITDTLGNHFQVTSGIEASRRGASSATSAVTDQCVCAAGDGERRLVCLLRVTGSGRSPGTAVPAGTSSQVGFSPGSLTPQPKGLKRNHDRIPFPCGRLFLVHADGSGLELLSSQTVEEGFHQARSDPAVALLKEPLPDSGARSRSLSEVLNIPRMTSVSFSGGFGITVLRPARRSLWSQWTVGKRVPEITPPNLRDRSWAHFPRTEVRRV